MAGYAKVDKPKSSRERMLESQRALHESFRDDIADAKDYAAENAKNRREAHITALYAFGVVGFIFLMGIAMYLCGWK
jgi:predicted secreted acid phosphatase